MVKVAAVTHTRSDDFFLDLWVKYYSSLVGAENCYVMLDGDDWECRVDLSSVNVRVLEGRFYRRTKNDARLSDEHKIIATELLAEYDYLIKTDCDEFVCVDPLSGMSFSDVLMQADEHGFIHSLGVDVVERSVSEASIDPTQPIMAQREFGFMTKVYCKPNIFSRVCEVKAGGHRVRGGAFVLSKNIFMLHLANIDRGMFEDRAKIRMTESGARSYAPQLEARRQIFDIASSDVEPVSLDVAVSEIHDLMAEKEGFGRFVNGNTMIMGNHPGFLVEFGDRFRDIT